MRSSLLGIFLCSNAVGRLVALTTLRLPMLLTGVTPNGQISENYDFIIVMEGKAFEKLRFVHISLGWLANT